MTERCPSFFILVPGPWHDAEEVRRALETRGIASEVAKETPIEQGSIRVDVIEDSELSAAFRFARLGPLDPRTLAGIAATTRAALIECGFQLDDAPGALAQLGRALRDAGGIAVRMEASGGASDWEPWLEHLESGDPARLYEAAVLLVRDSDGLLFTCGMHQFNLPDAQILTADPAEAVIWINAFSIYQLEEQPALLSGHTFRPNAELPRRTIERWPDHRHQTRDGRNNPFGLWRFLEIGAPGIDARKPVLVIIPALVVLLVSAERSAKRPLSPPEVEAIVEKASAIAMDAADAAVLERKRGYADIEPQRAWEQWQIVRGTL